MELHFVIYGYAMYVCVTCIVFSLYLYNSSDCNKAWWNEHAYFYIHFLTWNVKLPSKSWFRIRFQNFKSITSHTLHPHNITKQHSYTYLIELPNQDSTFSTTLKRLLHYCISFFISQGKSCNFVPYKNIPIWDNLDFLHKNLGQKRHKFQ